MWVNISGSKERCRQIVRSGKRGYWGLRGGSIFEKNNTVQSPYEE